MPLVLRVVAAMILSYAGAADAALGRAGFAGRVSAVIKYAWAA